MSDKHTNPNEEKVTIGCYISLALAIVFFSGMAAGSGYFWSFLDFTTLMGSAGKVVGKVSESGDGLAVTMTTLRGIGGETDVVITLENQIFAGCIQRSIEFRIFFQRGHTSLDHESQYRQLDIVFPVPAIDRFPEDFQFGHIGLFILRHMRNHDPVTMQIGTTDLFDA